MIVAWIVLALLVGAIAGAAAAWMLTAGNARIAQLQREEFLALANERVSAIVSPVQEKLGEFDALVQSMERERAGAYQGLREQIAGLIERNGKMEAAASHLTSALRNPTTRGKWGEVQLRRVVELAGMEPYCDYGEQQTFDLGDERGRPDLTVALPGNAKIFVDAKVPLSAYLDAIEAPDDAARGEKLRSHAGAFKSHVDALARKDYRRAGGSAAFVVMFVPGEAFLSAACIENPDLIEYGAAKGVYIASPLTLMALLRSYAAGWQQLAQEENAKKIAEAARELYDRVRVFASHFVAIGQSLEKAASAYNKAVGSMESRVLPQGRKIKELASLADADLPELQAIETAPREVTSLDVPPRSA
jgi:DNA recombination protein RmuC